VNAAAKPKRQRIASSEWRIVFLEGSGPALPKIFGTSGDALSRIFRRMNSVLKRFVINHWLKPVA
jgi:hypothetical protein